VKRFYKEVTAAEVEGGFGIKLDQRTLRTPAKRPLILPTAPLAEALAEEWAAQEDEIRPDTMPLMKLVGTALDLVVDRRDAVIDEAANYAGTDMLCYRADAPAKLVERQARLWQPHLDWAALRFDAPLHVTTGIVPIAQPKASLRALRAALAVYDPLPLTAVADLTALCGSLVLALAIAERRLDAEAGFEAAMLDESFEIEQWGEDAEATRRRARQRRDLAAAVRLLALFGRLSKFETSIV